jgi:hypothetical protein
MIHVIKIIHKIMAIILMLFLISVVCIVWLLPILLSIYLNNYWVLLLYTVWWVPAFTISILASMFVSEIL